MRRLIEHALTWLEGETLKLFFLAGAVLLVWGTFAPVGTLMWWLKEGTKSPELQPNSSNPATGANAEAASPQINCYVVYLPGVGDFSANQLTAGEEFFLSHLIQRHPNCVAVDDVFPYSAANESLGGKRVFAPVWNAIEHADGWLDNVDVLIKIRNLWRFAISADDRYGPVYNRGIATAVVDRMNAAHPIPPSGRPSQGQSQQPLNLILIGTSGGVQVALGAAKYLHQWLNARLIVVSAGGDFEGRVGFDAIDHMYHLQGARDWIEDLSRFIFPSRWPLTVGSPLNQARREGRYQVLRSGPHTHDGPQGYFGLDRVGDTGKTYVELTLQTVEQLPIWSIQSPQQPTR